MAKRLSIIFDAIDNASFKLSSIASIGSNTVSVFQRMEDSAGQALSETETGASAACSALDRESASADRLANSLDGYGQEADMAARSAEGFAYAQDAAIDTLSDIENAADRASQGMNDYEESARGADRRTEGLGESVSELGSILAAAGIVVALKEIGRALADCAAQGEVFETSIAKLQTISGGDSISRLQGEILALSNETGQAADALADTAYNAISAGTAVEDSVSMAATASELAVAGFTDTSSALSVLTTAVNSYGDAAGSAEHISDSLVTVQNLGVTTVAELSQQMGKAISTASAYNVSLENLESGYISVTKAGINAAEGTTYLSSMFNELGNTGSAVSKLIQEETGRSFGQLMDDGQSVADVLGIVYEKCNQNAEAMMNMWGSAEAGKAANAIISQGLDTFNGNLETLKTSAGVTESAYAVMADTTAYAHNKMDNAAKNLQTTIGGQLNPTLEKLYNAGSDILAKVNDFVDKNPEVLQALAVIGSGVVAFVGSIVIYEAATKAAQLATKLFNAELLANPIFWIIGGVAALSVGLYELSQALGNVDDETAGMTATTREQYYELQDLNSEYEKACEKYGETSEEASRLRYQVDTLSESFDANRQTVEEFVAEADALCESVSKMTKEFDDGMNAVQNTEAGTLALIQRYKDLAGQAVLTEAQEKELEAVTGKLSEKYPDLATGLEGAASGAEGYAEAMKRLCEQEAEKQRQEQAEDTYVEALQKRAELTDEITKAQENLNLEQKRMDGMSTWEHFFAGGEYDDFNAYKEKISELNAAQEENEEVIARIERQWQGLADAEGNAAGEAGSFEQAVSGALGSVKEEMDALTSAYDETYAAALGSIEGQYSLWDNVGSVAKMSMDDLNAALDSQTRYWENYANNLNALTEKAGQIEGLGEVLKQMDDGSEESASALAAMASASDEQLGKMVEKYGSLKDAQSKTAEGVTELENDFRTKMDGMMAKMEETVAGMDMEAGAAEAARKTMQGYINSIQNMVPSVTSAAAAAAQAAANALGSASGGGKTPVSTPVKGHARGTTDSERFYIAGEEGPELIISGGGDEVFPASETNRIISAVSQNSGNPQITESVSEFDGKGAPSDAAGSSDRTLTIKLEGSGSVSVGHGASAESLWESVKGNFKQAFMSMLQEEIYEEGAGAYEF